MADKERHNSFEDDSFGIGQNTDGSFNIYPASELPALLERQRREEEATTFAIKQMEAGFPAEKKPDGPA